MAAVTQRIGSYLGGVSKQSDDKKLPGQVRELVNAMNDPRYERDAAYRNDVMRKLELSDIDF